MVDQIGPLLIALRDELATIRKQLEEAGIIKPLPEERPKERVARK